MSNMSQQNEILLERAKSAMLSRDYPLASRLYKGLLQSDPRNMMLLSSLAEAYVKSGSDELAIPLYNEMIRLKDGNVNAMNELGAIFRRLKRYDESIAVLERAIIEDESNTQIFYNLGFTYKLMGKYDDAIQCFKKVVDENPGDVLAFNHLGSIYEMQKNHSAAIEAYQLGLKADANHPVLHLNLAKTYESTGDWEKAAKEFEAALRSKPGWVDAIDDYADLLIETNRTKDASEIVKQAISINPQNKAMRTKLGKVYARQNKFEDAEKEFAAVLKIDADDRNALSALADTYENQGKSVDAVKTMQHMEQLLPEDDAVMKQFAGILLTAEKMNAASQRIKKVWDKNPNDVETLNLLAQYYICTGEEAKARGCFKKIDAIDPSYTAHFRDGGKRYNQRGDVAKAEEYLSSYVQRKPDDIFALTLLASVYEKQDKYADALRCYKQIASTDVDNMASVNGIQRVNRRIISASMNPNDDLDLNSLIEDGDAADFDIAPTVSPAEDDDLALPESIPEEETTVVKENTDFDDLAEVLSEEDSNKDFIDPVEFEDDSVDALDSDELDEEQSEIIKMSEDNLDNLANSDIDDDSIENALDDFMLANSDNSVSSTNTPSEDDMDIGFEEEELAPPEEDNSVTLPDFEDEVTEEAPIAPEEETFEPEEEAPLKNEAPSAPVQPATEIEDEPYEAQLVSDEPVKKEIPFENEIPMEEESIPLQTEKPEEIIPEEEIVPEKEIAQEEEFIAPEEDFIAQEEEIVPEKEIAPEEEFIAPEEEIVPEEEIIPEENEELNSLLENDIIPVQEEDSFEAAEEEEEPPIEEESISVEEETLPVKDEISVEDEIPVKDEISVEEEIPVEEESPVEEIIPEEESLPVEEESFPLEDIVLDEPEVDDLPAEEIPEDFTEDTADDLTDDVIEEIPEEKNEEFEEPLFDQENICSETCALFKKLKDLSGYLPEEEHEDFIHSDKLLRLEYVIAKLSGGEGLLSVAEEIRGDSISEPDCNVNLSGISLVKSVLEGMLPYVRNLDDENLASSLEHEIESLMEKLS